MSLIKFCPVCAVEKSTGEFKRNRRARDGLTYKCKSCIKIREKERLSGSPSMARKHPLIEVGQRFGKLVVLQRSDARLTNQESWVCQCDCGEQKIIRGYCLVRKLTRSCGCLRSDSAKARKRKYEESLVNAGKSTGFAVVTLSEAKAQSKTYYFTGKPCHRGHVAPRSVKSQGCTACAIINKKNRPPKVGYLTPQRIEKIKLQCVINVAKRRSRLLGNTSGKEHSKPKHIRAIKKFQDQKCASCGIVIGEGRSFHADHISPISRGGSNHPTNIQALCPPCNFTKRTKTGQEFYRSSTILDHPPRLRDMRKSISAFNRSLRISETVTATLFFSSNDKLVSVNFESADDDAAATLRDLAIAINLAIACGSSLALLRSAMSRSDDGEALGSAGKILDHLAVYGVPNDG